MLNVTKQNILLKAINASTYKNKNNCTSCFKYLITERATVKLKKTTEPVWYWVWGQRLRWAGCSDLSRHRTDPSRSPKGPEGWNRKDCSHCNPSLALPAREMKTCNPNLPAALNTSSLWLAPCWIQYICRPLQNWFIIKLGLDGNDWEKRIGCRFALDREKFLVTLRAESLRFYYQLSRKIAATLLALFGIHVLWLKVFSQASSTFQIRHNNTAVASNRPTEALASVISFTFVVYSHYKHS